MPKKQPPISQTLNRYEDLTIREVKSEERRISVSFSSEQIVSRWYGSEVLSHDAECIDLQRINDIGVALFNHNRDKVIGKIENAYCDDEEKRAYADIVFDDDELSLSIFRKVENGTLKGVSVGYKVSNWEEVAAGKVSTNGRFQGPAYVATRWTPMEISIVSVPADETVGVGRSEEEGEESMPNVNPETNPTRGAEPPREMNPASNSDEIIRAERERVKEISSICREFEIDADPFISEGHTVDSVRAAVLEQLKTKNRGLSSSSGDISVTKDEADKFREAASDAILLKSSISVEKPAEGARDLRSMRMRDLAIESLRIIGVNAIRMNDDELFKRALSPDSQFASILSDTVNKSMAKAYTASPTTYQGWTGKGSVSDFKGATHYQISEAGNLEKMTQTGEFTFDEMEDSGVTKAIATFGKEFGITRKAMIDDDLSIITKIPQAYVRAAGRGINSLVYQLLKDNPKMKDGKNLFSESHNNLAATGSAITVESIGARKAAMRKQKNLRGKETLNISPRYLIVSPDKEVEAMQLINSITDPRFANANVMNPFRNAFDIIVDAELDGNEWYLAADPSDIDTIEVTYLNGDEMPKLESQIGFDYLGMKWRIYIDYGVNLLDYRGLAKNPGNN